MCWGGGARQVVWFYVMVVSVGRGVGWGGGG